MRITSLNIWLIEGKSPQGFFERSKFLVKQKLSLT